MSQRNASRDQVFVLPPAVAEWVPADHPVRFVAMFVDGLAETTWAEMQIPVQSQRLGAPRYAPRMLASVWVYGFMSGIRSTRALERSCAEQLPVRWLTGNSCPDHNTLWRFYQAHRVAMRLLLTKTVEAAAAAKLLNLVVMAVDGTKLRANAAADRSLTADDLAALLEQTRGSIAEMEARIARGEDRVTPSLPGDLRTDEALRERVEAAIAQCAERAAAVGKAASVGPARANVTDPEARWMKLGKVIEPGYNAQAAVVALNQRARTILGDDAPGGRFVVAASVTTQPTDQHQLMPVVAAAVTALGEMPDVTVADAGYHSGETLAAAEQAGYAVALPESSVVDPETSPYHRAAFVYDPATNTLRCPQGETLYYRFTASDGGRRYHGDPTRCLACQGFGTCTTNRSAGRIVTLTEHDDVVQRQRQSRAQPTHQAAMAQRKHLIEPVFGIVKDVLRGRRCLLRGRRAVEAEWTLLATALNLRTLVRIWRALPPAQRDAMFPVRSTS